MRSMVLSPAPRPAHPAAVTAPVRGEAPPSRRSVALRRTVSLVAALATTVLGGCRWITGVPEVCRVQVTAQPNSIPARSSANASGDSFSCSGARLNHPRTQVRLSSSDPTKATVSTGGSIFGIAPGTVWIVGEAQGKRDSVQVTITSEIPPIIDVEPNPVNLTVGQSTRLTVTPRRGDGVPIPNLPVTFSSIFPGIATVDSTGVVRAVALGETSIRVSISGRDRTVAVLVRPATVERVTIAMQRNPIRRGERVPVVLRLFDGGGRELETLGRDIRYRSSDNTVATVDGSGVVTGITEGTARITVTVDGNDRGSVDVRVTELPVAFVIVPQLRTYRVGAQNSLVPTALDSLNRELSLAGRQREYVVADPTILTINPQGLVNPLKVGTTTVRVRVDTASAVATVQVTEMPIGRVRIDSVQVQRIQGQTFQYTATLFDSLGTVVSGRRISWTSGNPQIAAVNAATGLATAITPGTVRIGASVDRVPGFADVVSDVADFIVLPTPVATVAVAPGSLTLRAGQNRVVSIILRDAAGEQIEQLYGRTISVTSSDPTIAFGNGNGSVNGVSAGTATLTYRVVDAAGRQQGTAATLTVTVTASASASVRPSP